jgi:hypothetical protein
MARSPSRPADRLKEPDHFDLEDLSGVMTARALALDCDLDEAKELKGHELAEPLLRWLRRQGPAIRTGLLVAHGLREP